MHWVRKKSRRVLYDSAFSASLALHFNACTITTRYVQSKLFGVVWAQHPTKVNNDYEYDKTYDHRRGSGAHRKS